RESEGRRPTKCSGTAAACLRQTLLLFVQSTTPRARRRRAPSVRTAAPDPALAGSLRPYTLCARPAPDTRSSRDAKCGVAGPAPLWRVVPPDAHRAGGFRAQPPVRLRALVTDRRLPKQARRRDSREDVRSRPSSGSCPPESARAAAV